MWACDSRTNFGEIYTGKLPGTQRKVNQGKRVVLSLVSCYRNSGRTIYKVGVDTMDQMVSAYTCKLGINRWPLTMFYNVLDIAGLASFLIYNDLQPVKQSNKRRKFLTELAIQLVIPHMEKQAMNSNVTSQSHIKQSMAKFQVIVSKRSLHVKCNW